MHFFPVVPELVYSVLLSACSRFLLLLLLLSACFIRFKCNEAGCNGCFTSYIALASLHIIMYDVLNKNQLGIRIGNQFDARSRVTFYANFRNCRCFERCSVKAIVVDITYIVHCQFAWIKYTAELSIDCTNSICTIPNDSNWNQMKYIDVGPFYTAMADIYLISFVSLITTYTAEHTKTDTQKRSFFFFVIGYLSSVAFSLHLPSRNIGLKALIAIFRMHHIPFFVCIVHLFLHRFIGFPVMVLLFLPHPHNALFISTMKWHSTKWTKIALTSCYFSLSVSTEPAQTIE